MANTLVDWKGAFDSVSHKGLQNALHRAGATNKTRAMIKALYEAATIRIKIGKEYTDPIKICRGVIQGDISSPLIFIIVLNDVFIHADAIVKPEGIKMMGKSVSTLGFADDIALQARKDRIQLRLQNLQNTSYRLCSMQYNIRKCGHDHRSKSSIREDKNNYRIYGPYLPNCPWIGHTNTPENQICREIRGRMDGHGWKQLAGD